MASSGGIFFLPALYSLYSRCRNVGAFKSKATVISVSYTHLDVYKRQGLCHHKKRIKQIFLHEDLKEWEERFVLAHEIGHLVMHPNHNAPFLQTTFFSRSRYEIEANKFAAELIISDTDLRGYRDYTISQIAGIYGCLLYTSFSWWFWFFCIVWFILLWFRFWLSTLSGSVAWFWFFCLFP